MLQRPQPQFDPQRSMLKNEHFQIAYVTNDIEQAKAVFRDRYGIANFISQQGHTPCGGNIHVELAWSGGVMFELIEASGAGSQFYNDRLPRNGFAIRHHHLGYMIWSDANWQAFETKVAREGWLIEINTNIEGFLRVCYIHAPEMDHYLEFIHPEPAGIAFFNSVPEG